MLHRCPILLCCILGMMLIGCGADKPPETAQQIAEPSNARPANSGTPANQPAQQIVAPPVGAQWTIYCFDVTGPGHVEQMNQLKNQLQQQTRMPAWYVLHEEGKSSLYHGYYKEREGAEIQRDRKAVAGFRDKLGNMPFTNAVIVPMDSPDPASPREWNLVNSGGFWSIQIAAFQGNALRKEAAVQAVRDLREQGVDAYYYHGPNASSVCVGAYPEAALQRQEQDSAQTIDPTQPIMVINGELPDYTRRQLQSGMKDRQGNPMRVFVQSVEIVDPKMLAMMKQFSQHFLNYEPEVLSARDNQTGKVTQTPKPSVVVPIPRKQDSAITSDRDPTRPDLLNPQQQRGSQLRRVGD